MNWKTLSSVFIATFLLTTIVSDTYVSSGSALSVTTFGPATPINNFTGIVNISANGSVSYHGTGNTNIIDRAGNIYTLEGEIFGTINIMHNVTIFNGQNYTMSGNGHEQNFTMNILKAKDVSIKNLRINTDDQAGILVNQSSNDTFANLNIKSAIVALIIGAQTDNISVENSEFALNTSVIAKAFLTNTILTGMIPSNGNFNFIESSKYVNFSNDIIYNSALNTFGVGAIINSANTEIYNITVIATANSGLCILGNYTSVKSSHFNGYLKNSIAIGPQGNYISPNTIISGNSFNISPDFDPTAGNPVCAITAYSSNVTISGNSFMLGNATSGNTGSLFEALHSSYSNINLVNNHITLNNTGCNIANAISEYSGNLAMKGNNISMLNTIETNQAVSTSNTNIVAMNNDIYFYSGTPVSNAGAGFQSTGGNITEHGNRIVSVRASIIGISNTKPSNISITENTLEFYNSSITNGVTLTLINDGQQSNITGNYIYENSSSYSSIGIDLYGMKATYLGNNTVIQNNDNTSVSLGLYFRNLNGTVLNGNMFDQKGSSAPDSIGIKMFNASKSTFSNNTFLNYNTDIFSKLSYNDSFYGNYFNNSTIPLNLTSTNNSIFYHNDFIYNKRHNFILSSSSNDLFNLSMSVGGNYWSSYNGSDKNNDGIGDSPFDINGTFNDQYPLMKPWVRPVVAFMVPSLMVGTLWSVTFNGKTVQSYGSEIVFTVINAQYQNYSYEYYNTSLYYTSIQSGYLHYNGTGIVSNIPYLHYSYIVGTLNVQNSSVYVNGKEITIVNGKFNITVTAGVYNVRITAPGYEPFNSTYDITPGETLHIPPLTKIPPSPTSGPKPYNWDNIIIIIILVAVVAAVIGIYLRKTNKI